MKTEDRAGKFRKALFDTGSMKLSGRRMVGGDLAELYNLIANNEVAINNLKSGDK